MRACREGALLSHALVCLREGDGLFHIKAIMVDGVRIYLGSANLSVNAVTNSAEWGLISESPDMCRQLEGYLHHLESKGQFREV